MHLRLVPFTSQNSFSRVAVGVTVATGLMLLVGGCGPKKKRVARVATDSQTDLSGKWNDTDAQLTGKALIADCFAGGWLGVFKEEEGRKPALRVRRIVNKTSEHIDPQIFVKSFERAMVNSARVRVLAQEGSELGSVEAEQDRGASGAQSDDTAARMGEETGADFVFVARLSSIVDQIDGQKAVFYKINAELISPNSGEKVWIGEHMIKKIINQRAVGW